MDIAALITAVSKTPDCQIEPSIGQPAVGRQHEVPDDLQQFYELCGGLRLFQSSLYPVFIVPPQNIVRANPVIVGEVCEEDISSDWYILANDGNGDYFTIDLKHERLGRCYDSFWDRHAVVGSTAVIAASFTDFLARMFANKGRHWYFAQPDFVSLGDAYDP